MKPFTESLRYEYSLTPKSRVLDIGCYQGNWSYEIRRKYGCQIVALEPVQEFYWNCVRKLMPVGVAVLPYGLSDHACFKTFGIHGDMTGEFTEGNMVEVELITVEELLRGIDWRTVDLMKINSEGAEYGILESMIQNGLIRSVNHLQVQFHSLGPDYMGRKERIFAEMAKTHKLEWHEEWVWTGWGLE